MVSRARRDTPETAPAPASAATSSGKRSAGAEMSSMALTKEREPLEGMKERESSGEARFKRYSLEAKDRFSRLSLRRNSWRRTKSSATTVMGAAARLKDDEAAGRGEK